MKDTKSLLSIQSVPEDHQIGLVWLNHPDGYRFGFVYDHDEIEKYQVVKKVFEYVNNNDLGLFDNYSSREINKLEEDAKFENVSRKQFFLRFGSLPTRKGMYFDEGGVIDSPNNTFNAGKAFPKAIDEVQRKERIHMIKCGTLAGFLTASIVTFLIAAFFICGSIWSGGNSELYAFWVGTVGLLSLAIFGLAFIFSSLRLITLRLYYWLYFKLS